MIEQQQLNITYFTLLVNAHLTEQGNQEQLYEAKDWTSFVHTWGTELGLHHELIAELANKRYFVDANYFFQRTKQQIEDGTSPIDTILSISADVSRHSGYPILQKGVAKSCAAYLSSCAENSDTAILCCGFSALPVVLILLTQGLRVDWHFPPRDPIESSLLPYLPKICGAGQLTIKSLESRIGPLAGHKSMASAFVLPTGYSVGFYLLPNYWDSPIDGESAEELADTSMILHFAEILWSRKQAQQKFREELVDRNILQSVLLLPPGGLNFSGVQLAALLLQKVRQSNLVQFADFSNEKLSRKDSDWQIPFDSLSKTGVKVSVQSLAASGYLLDVKRHVMACSQELQTMTAGESFALKDLVSITRAQSIPEDDGSGSCMAIREVLASDINDLGIIREPQKNIQVGQNGVSRAINAWLKHGDILIAIKGSVGKIGFVQDTLADITDSQDGDNKWVAGQSFVKLRIKPSQTNKLTPEYLFRYLKSPQVQKYFASRSLGVSIPMIKMTDIEALPVRLPAKQAIEGETALHNKQLAIEKEIQRLQQELKNLELDLNTLS